jgi:hypothetical protein
MDHYFREPFSAAVIAAAITMGYVYIKAKMNNEKLKNSSYFKPAFMTALLVYFIVAKGNGHRESLATQPF